MHCTHMKHYMAIKFCVKNWFVLNFNCLISVYKKLLKSVAACWSYFINNKWCKVLGLAYHLIWPTMYTDVKFALTDCRKKYMQYCNHTKQSHRQINHRRKSPFAFHGVGCQIQPKTGYSKLAISSSAPAKELQWWLQSWQVQTAQEVLFL